MIVIQDDMLRDVIARTLHISEERDHGRKAARTERAFGPLCRRHSRWRACGIAENLEYLDLCGNSIEILDPIRDLRNIERLNVSNRLRDLQALHGYRQLKKLDISRNNLYTMDISAVAGMIDLEELNLERSKVDNIISSIPRSCACCISG
ncbi:MAG: leucine-rich repeat domain-containing protein [Merdibacter sp.]